MVCYTSSTWNKCSFFLVIRIKCCWGDRYFRQCLMGVSAKGSCKLLFQCLFVKSENVSQIMCNERKNLSYFSPLKKAPCSFCSEKNKRVRFESGCKKALFVKTTNFTNKII